MSILDDIEKSMKKGNKINEHGFFSWTFYLVNYGVHSNRNEMVERLIKNVYPYSMAFFSETVNTNENSILMCAIKNYNDKSNDAKSAMREYDLIERLLKCGVDPNFKNTKENTALAIALENPNKELKDKMINMLGKYCEFILESKKQDKPELKIKTDDNSGGRG